MQKRFGNKVFSQALTAGMYPLRGDTDTLRLTATIAAATLRETLYQVGDGSNYGELLDTIAVGAAISAGTLAQPYVRTEDHVLFDFDSIAATATVSAGNLRVALADHSLFDTDTIAATATVTGGYIAVTLVDHIEFDIDTIALGATITAGTLV